MARIAGSDPVRVVAIDDDQMLLDGLSHWLTGAPQIELVCAVTTVTELARCGYPPAEVALLDLRLRDGSDPAANVVCLTERGYRVLVISTVPAREAIVSTLRAGADGYLTKDHDLPTLVEAVTAVAAGDAQLSPALAFALAHDRDPQRPQLSPQEREVLVAYASGLTLTSAARAAGVRPGTAKEYLDRVKAKYQQANRPANTKLELAQRVREDDLAP